MELAEDAATMAAGQDAELAASARLAALEALEARPQEDITAPELAGRMMRAVARVTGVDDPFAAFKLKEMTASRRALQALGEDMPSGLAGLARLAALGNSLDFFQDTDQAVQGIRRELAQGVDFARNDLARLEQALQRGVGLMLYLTDNAGEVYFDLPLFHHLAARVQRLVLVVKGGPALNDLTRRELVAHDLERVFGEVADTGSATAGLVWAEASPRFRSLAGQADVVLAKGMANFETMYDSGLPAACLFLFKVKCRPVKDHLHAPPHSYWALWQEALA